MNIRFKKAQAIDYMNTLGLSKRPFVFFIDYHQDQIIISEDWSKEKIYFDFGTLKNYPKTTGDVDSFYIEKYPISYQEYLEGFSVVRQALSRGDSYLINLTYPTRIQTNWSMEEIFTKTKAEFKGYLPGKFVFFSPEKFIEIESGMMRTFPMKGTIRADIPQAEQRILDDPKENAEHSTIVDLLRNDLSRVCSKVKVNRFRYIDRIQSDQNDLLQVSSEIEGAIRPELKDKIGDLLFTLLPAGSITGAPKKKTLELIQKAEMTQRGYYTGICGYFDGEVLKSGVMIRMIQMGMDKELYFHSGGGITYQSEPKKEYQELLDKVYVPITRNYQDTRREDMQHSLS